MRNDLLKNEIVFLYPSIFSLFLPTESDEISHHPFDLLFWNSSWRKWRKLCSRFCVKIFLPSFFFTFFFLHGRCCWRRLCAARKKTSPQEAKKILLGGRSFILFVITKKNKRNLRKKWFNAKNGDVHVFRDRTHRFALKVFASRVKHKLVKMFCIFQFHFARKRRSVQVKLDYPQRPSVAAKVDRVIHLEEKPLKNLLENQLDFLPSLKSIKKHQKEISTEFRKNAVIWLEEVCLESKCEVAIFPLAISLMDRFLSKQFVPKQHLQALASACLLLAGKVKAPIPLTAKTIAYYTDGAVNVEQLLVSASRWNSSKTINYN